MGAVAGEAFNIGGGPDRTISLLELIDIINRHEDRPVALRYDAWREADQRYYVSDTRKFADATGWFPSVSVPEGIAALRQWLRGAAATPRGAAATLVS